MREGQFQVYTGDGKGKTTAALGLALRAAGAGCRVYIGQFMKRGDFREVRSLRQLSNVTLEQFGSDRGLLLNRGADRSDIDCAVSGHARLLSAMTSGEYDLVIADEINCACSFGLLKESDLIELIDRRPEDVELVFTGRNAPEAVIERADLVTEMRMVRHYFASKGLQARIGIEK